MAQNSESRFSDFDLAPEVQRVLPDLGFVTPTPIQARAIPVALEGQDVLGKAETGTGKTLAFGLPLISRLDPERTAAQALVLLPTRELAQQVAESLEPIAKERGLRVALLVGGEKVRFQRSRIPGRQIVVGTPGRILDLLQERYLHLEWSEVFVLDEFDRMLDMGFIEDVQKIVAYLPKERQTLLFSATVPSEIRRLVDELLEDPVVCEVSTGLRTAKGVSQSAIRCHGLDRLELLIRLLEKEVEEEDGTAVVFCNTRRAVSELDREFWGRGLPAAALSGDYEQSQRFKVMEGFRAQRIRVLVATDVASRGLDVDHIGHVINYDVPLEPEDYVHRIGRTARAGREGRVTTFVVPAQEKAFRRILDRLGKEIRIGEARLEKSERRAVDSASDRSSLERRPPNRNPYAAARSAMSRGGPVRDDIAARRADRARGARGPRRADEERDRRPSARDGARDERRPPSRGGAREEHRPRGSVEERERRPTHRDQDGPSRRSPARGAPPSRARREDPPAETPPARREERQGDRRPARAATEERSPRRDRERRETRAPSRPDTAPPAEAAAPAARSAPAPRRRRGQADDAAAETTPVRPSPLAKRLKARLTAPPPPLTRVARDEEPAAPRQDGREERKPARPARGGPPRGDRAGDGPPRGRGRGRGEGEPRDTFWEEAPGHSGSGGRGRG